MEGFAAIAAPEAIVAAATPSAAGEDEAAQGAQALKDAIAIREPFVRVGRGTFGTVFRCEAFLWGSVSDLAVKVQQKQYDSAHEPGLRVFRDAQRRVMEEIRILASFGLHPTGVAPLLSWTETHFNWQTVFPFYERDMFTSIRQAYFHMPHNDNNLRVASRALLKGLEYIHSRRVVHCDVKPNNVLISAAGEAVLGDFGSARVL